MAQAGHPVAAIPMVRQWQTYTDPNEGSFSVQMPAGWKNSVGLKRYDALQYRAWVASFSPDGRTILALGDANEPAYTTPMYGFRIGSIYNASGTYYVVEPLQSAQQYVVSWGQRKLQSLCSNIRVTASRARPDVGQQLAGLASMGMSHTYADATFSCQKDGIELTGYAFLGISFMRTTAYSALWWPDSMSAFLSPKPVAGIAASLLAHMVKSMTPNAMWVARQSRTAMNVSEITTQTNAAISDGIMQGWEQRSAAIDQTMAEGSRERQGVEIYKDPSTGTEYTLGNGYQYYWIDDAGRISGTQTDTPPAVGVKRLQLGQ